MSTAQHWLWEPRIERRALTLISGPSAFELVLGIAAAVGGSSSMPPTAHGHVLLVGDQPHAWRRLSAAGVPRERGSTLEPSDAEGKVRALMLQDLSTLAEALGRVRPALTIVAGLRPTDAALVAALADLAAEHASALVAVSADPVAPELEALASSALRTFERPSGEYVLRRGMRHVASRIGPRAPSIAFEVRGELIAWKGILDDPEPAPPIEHEAHVKEPDQGHVEEPDRAIGTPLDAVVQSALEDALAVSDPVLEAEPADAIGIDAESDLAPGLDVIALWLIEQLAEGPRAAGEVIRSAAARGIPERTLRRRALSIGVELRRVGFPSTGLWALPGTSALDAGQG